MFGRCHRAAFYRTFRTSCSPERKAMLLGESKIHGNGIYQIQYHPGCSKYITQPPSCWSGEDYIRAILLRLNLLPCKGIPSNPPNERHCRTGCQKVESVSHILQNYPMTHWDRIKRHNYVVKRLINAAHKHRWKATLEPHIRGSDQILKKPDIIFEGTAL